MLEHIFDLLGDVKKAAERGDATAVHYACKRIVPEMCKLDSRDFLTEEQGNFVRAVAALDSWGKSIIGVNVRKLWPEIEPVITRVLKSYTGEGSRGDPNFKNKQLAITSPNISIPPELSISLPRFLVDHPDTSRSAFIMIQFGKLYKPFDTQNVATSIPQVLTKWMEDHDMVKA